MDYMEFYEEQDPVYIKMCKVAKEIQELWRPRIGDNVLLKPESEVRHFVLKYKAFPFGYKKTAEWKYSSHIEDREVSTFVTNLNGSKMNYSTMIGWDDYNAAEIYLPCMQYYTAIENLVWLPHQDQLQRMFDFYPDKPLPPHKLIKSLWDWWAEDLYSRDFSTHGQLLLAFLYKEKYHKIWNGADWRVNDESV